MNQQRSEQWFADRVGKATASRIADAISKLKNGKESAARRAYRAQLVSERLTGIPQGPELGNIRAIKWGVDNEENARKSYEFESDNVVELSGFVCHPKIQNCGASPDGLVGSDGLIEIKCPNTCTHIDYILNDVVPEDYIPQMTLQIACTGRTWCDFVSYDPRLNASNRLFIKRFTPTPQAIAEMEAQVIEFLQEVDAMHTQLTER